MNRYEIYKETDFEWIGEIPFDWELSRVGKFFNERSVKVDDVSYPPLSVTMSGIVDQLSDVAKTKDGGNRKLVKKDDFVINSRSDRKGSSGIAPRDGSVSLINIVLEPHGLYPQFIEHLFKSYYFKEEYFRNGKGIHWDLWTTRWDQFKNINIPIPSIEEQKLIAHYLDKKTEQIDRLIDKTQKKIELLKEQRTAWIDQCINKGSEYNLDGKISHLEGEQDTDLDFKKKKLKYLFKINKGILPQSLKSEKEKDTFPYLSMNVLRGGNPTEFTEINNCVFARKGDIAILWDGSNAGEILKINVTGVLSSTVALLRVSNSDLKQDYAFYLLKSLESLIKFNTIGMGIPHVNGDFLKNLEVNLPPIKEQERITNVLESNLLKLQKSMFHHIDKISLLKEYRQSLVSSVTTGQVLVTEDMI